MTGKAAPIAYTIELETTTSYARSAGIAPLSTMDALVRSVAERIKTDPGDLVRCVINIAPDANDLPPIEGASPKKETARGR